MKKVILLLICISLVFVLAACSKTASGSEIKSNVSRETAPDVSVSQLAALVDGNTAFAFDLYQSLKADFDNFFYSPYSISETLAMVCGGARGDTEDQMADVLHFDLSRDELHKAFNYLDLELAKRGEEKDAESFVLKIVNAAWGQIDYQFSDEYLDLLAENYGAGVRVVDYVNDPSGSRQIINQWISDNTNGKIEEIISENTITDLTTLILANASYFKGAWKHKFMEADTVSQPFYLLDGGSVTVPMMKQTMLFDYVEEEDYQAIELRYKGDEISMLIILPEKDKFSEFESELDNAMLSDIVDSMADMEERNINLTMPKFNYESGFSLKEILLSAGMADAFDPLEADFSFMTGNRDLWLDAVDHKAYISVDESGTEAAAATTAIMVSSLPGTMTIDSPFIFLIRDIETGTVLFMGRVLNPS